MPETPRDTRVEDKLAEALELQIPALSILYDRWANSLDPFAAGIDEAEMAFSQTLAQMFDFVKQSDAEGTSAVDFRAFRRYVISKCKAHLAATRKHPTL